MCLVGNSQMAVNSWMSSSVNGLVVRDVGCTRPSVVYRSEARGAELVGAPLLLGLTGPEFVWPFAAAVAVGAMM